MSDIFKEEPEEGEVYEHRNTPEVQFHEHSLEIVELVGRETVWYLDRETASALAGKIIERLEATEGYVNQ